MFDEIRTFVVLAESGSIQRAAERLFLTPSAVSRQMQRLEATLATSLLDRRIKPARLTPAGHAVLKSGREVLRVVDDLKARASGDAEPTGAFRVGLSHALARPSLVASIRELARRFAGLQLVITTDLTQAVIEQARTGAVDIALAFLPAGPGVTSTTTREDDSNAGATVLAEERMVLVRSKAAGGRGRRPSLAAQGARALESPWVLNPRGCLVRAALETKLRELGRPLRVAAEIHNIDLQLSLVASGLGNGLFPERFLAKHPRRHKLRKLPLAFSVHAAVVYVRAAHLGPLEAAASFLESALRAHFAERS